MAQKDYVARGRTKKQAPPPPKTALPWLRIIITCILVAGFGYFLWSIKGKAPEKTDSTSVEKEHIKNIDETMPEIPEEEWDFIKSLPEYTVEIENQEQQSIYHYLMQCGSFRTNERAQEQKAKIAFQGLEAQVKTKDGRWYRVILGPYANKRLAEKDRHALQRIKINTCVFRRFKN